MEDEALVEALKKKQILCDVSAVNYRNERLFLKEYSKPRIIDTRNALHRVL
jgi:hypothetical protein